MTSEGYLTPNSPNTQKGYDVCVMRFQNSGGLV